MRTADQRAFTVGGGCGLPIAVAFVAISALAACGKSAPLNERPRPCVFDSECEAPLRCINAECIDPATLDGGRRTGIRQFGEPCELSEECRSGYCLGGPRGAFCSVRCGTDDPCPTGHVCKVAPDPADPDAGVQVALCAVPQPLLCQPCESDLDCGATGGDHCVVTDIIHRFCARDCTFEPCPEGYACTDTPRGNQCLPVDQSCDCKPDTAGRIRGCASENDAGICHGAQVCSADAGWGACDAPPAVFEDCNGIDDDCDGQTDEGLEGRTCTRSNVFGTCTGAETCQGAGGWRCEAPTPAQETCNYVDDDCDDVIDDGFRNAGGVYDRVDHCGGCGNACSVLIDHSVATTCEVDPTGAPECRVQQCAPGFFPSPDGRRCMQLADSLCRSCTRDSDCVGPGSRCIPVNGEMVCGRDCGPGSAFPGCPGGYVCQPQPGGGSQCVPANGTCQCNAQQIGTTRSCTLSTPQRTCDGYETCSNTASGPKWSACDVATFNPEQCDGVDNDCDGQVDEGFRNPVTNKYDAVEHCGFCNNDCSKYWSLTLQHTTGVCDASGPTPVCKMGPCLIETMGGTTFEWRDVNGDTADGCECRRVLGNTSVDEPEEKAPYVDENCDGIDGVIGDAIFVWSGHPPGGTGTLTSPFNDLTAALAAFPGSGKKYILVAEGAYTTNVLVGPGVRMYGGYSRDFRQRDPLLFTSTIRGHAPASLVVAQGTVHVKGVPPGAAATVVSGFTIRGADRTEATPDDVDGAPSYAVLLEDAHGSVRVTNNEIIGGRGGRGGRGSSGQQGFGRQVSPLLDGKNGIDHARLIAPCPAGSLRPGGAAGINTVCGANGSPGGSVTCPVFDWAAAIVKGNQAAYPPGSGRNGEGGFDWSFDEQSGFGCGHVTESGFPSNIQTHDGRDGQAGADGASGSGGMGAPSRARFGSVQGNRWVPSTFGATDGSTGGAAEGGGGGGAGGGTAHLPSGSCPNFEFGATGGGGGAGGCGGAGGRGGGAGGASIAVFVTYTTAPPLGQLPVLMDNRIQRGPGGEGGNGGFGGAGGLGGAGGFGGKPTAWSGSTGGKGGEGGNGGPGGGGGGGAGGPSFGILGFRVNPAVWATQNTFLTPASASTGGKGGAGGSSSGPAATGTSGVDGASANVHALIPCSDGCPAGAVCDGNGVCSAP